MIKHVKTLASSSSINVNKFEYSLNDQTINMSANLDSKKIMDFDMEEIFKNPLGLIKVISLKLEASMTKKFPESIANPIAKFNANGKDISKNQLADNVASIKKGLEEKMMVLVNNGQLIESKEKYKSTFKLNNSEATVNGKKLVLPF
jgi:hypothetical protein